MDKLILPDTNILILALAGQDPYASFLRKIIEGKKIVFSAICIAEFLVKTTSEEERIINGLFSAFPVLPVDLTVAQTAALYRREFLVKNKSLKLPDCLIAATAKINKVAIATLNRKDYPMTDIDIVDRF